MLKLSLVSILAVVAAGCGGGDDEEGPPPKARNDGDSPAPNKPAAAPTGVLKTYTHVEDVVTPEERETIRHAFKERDFVVDPSGENRDPFQSYVVMQEGMQADKTTVDPATELCAKKQLVATNYAIRDLKLAGIVARGTKRYALMQDTANYGHIVARGDCVGREKARVKDIGAGYITFEITPEIAVTQGGVPRPAEERSVQLYPGELTVTTPDADGMKRPTSDAIMPDQPVPGQAVTRPINQ
jgi:Tfp pilus assembly protein PilP